MSFDVFLTKYGSGENVEVNREKVLAVLHETHFRGPDQFNYYVIDFPDGSDVEMHAKGLDGSAKFDGCAFNIRGMSQSIIQFIFDVTKTGDMTLVAAMDNSAPIVMSEQQRSELPPKFIEEFGAAVLCTTAEQLGLLLRGGYTAWKKYRDHVVGRS